MWHKQIRATDTWSNQWQYLAVHVVCYCRQQYALVVRGVVLATPV
jgi:hypothetical protein